MPYTDDYKCSVINEAVESFEAVMARIDQLISPPLKPRSRRSNCPSDQEARGRLRLHVDNVVSIDANFRRNNADAWAFITFMTNSDNSEGAIQMLIWAIEDIVKTGNKKAEQHAPLALKYLEGKARLKDERTSR